MIVIREATKEDVGVLFDLIIGIAKFHDQEQFVATNPEEMLRAGFGDTPKFGALLATYNDEVAGYLSYTWNYSIWNGADYMNMDDLFVWEAFRGKRVGEKLMLKAKHICQNKGIRLIRWEVQQDNDKAISFYDRLGANMSPKGVFRWKF